MSLPLFPHSSSAKLSRTGMPMSVAIRSIAGFLVLGLHALSLSGTTAAYSDGGAETTAPRVALNRFGRQLKQLELSIPQYLLPTEKPDLCLGGATCCQEDDYTSPYHVMMLNNTQSTFGGRTYTTFFMNLMKSRTCQQSVDFAGCCNANISRIWIDVDPALKVKYATLNGQSASVTAQQDSNGFRIALSPAQMAGVIPTGTLMTVTVEGAVDELCPVPTLLGLDLGLCDVIVEGGTSSNPAACCPRGLTLPSSVPEWNPPTDYFQCLSDSSRSPFTLTLDSISAPFADSPTSKAANYSLTLRQKSGCVEGPNSCCGMSLSYMMIMVQADTQVTSLTVNRGGYPFSIAPWNQDGQVGVNALLVEGISLHVEDVPPQGLTLVISVQVPATAKEIPQLCSANASAVNSGIYGACSFFFHSEDSFCCPNGVTSAVAGPVLNATTTQPPSSGFSPPPGSVPAPPGGWPPSPPSPPMPVPAPPGGWPPSPPSPPSPVPAPPGGWPPSPPSPPGSGFPSPPASTCSPQTQVAIADTSMAFAYYEYTSSGSDTEFIFVISNQNNAACQGTKTHCTDVCAWTMAVQDSVTPALMFVADVPSKSGTEIVTRGAAASITFPYGPSGVQSVTYTIRAPSGTSLESLCRRDAHPDQGSWPCAVQVKSVSNVYSMVFFSQESVVIKNYPSPPVVQPGMCDLTRPMTDSCLRVSQASYNVPDASSTVFDFLVSHVDPSTSSCAEEEFQSLTMFRVLLQASVVDELLTSKRAQPQDTVQLNRMEGATWTSMPMTGESTHYKLSVAGLKNGSSVCMQGLPGQPASTCPVQFEGQANCFIGFVALVEDPTLTWIVPGDVGDSGGSSRAAIVGPAVAVPIFVVLAAALIAAVFYRRRKAANAELSFDSNSNLDAPLTGDADLAGETASVGAQLSASSNVSAAPSDVQLQVPEAVSPPPAR